MEKISSFFDIDTNLPNCSAHPNNKFFAINISALGYRKLMKIEKCVTRIGLFKPKFIGIRFYLAEISPKKKKKHLPNCSAPGVHSMWDNQALHL